MEFSYIAQGTIFFTKIITKIALGFEFVSSGTVKTSGVAEKVFVVKIIPILEKIKYIYINKYKFVASGMSTAGGLSRKLLNESNFKTSRYTMPRSFFLLSK